MYTHAHTHTCTYFNVQLLYGHCCLCLALFRLIARVKPLLVYLHGAAYAKVCGQEFDAASFSQAPSLLVFPGWVGCTRGHSFSVEL